MTRSVDFARKSIMKEHVMRDRTHRGNMGIAAIALAAAVASGTLGAGCASEAADGAMGSMSLDLQIAPGVTINTVNWAISNPGSGFTKSGSVNVRFSNTISFQTGGIPAGIGYSITLTAMSVD